MAKAKKTQRSYAGGKPLIAVDPCLPEFEGHPFFEKKAKAAKTLLAKVGLPKDLVKKHR